MIVTNILFRNLLELWLWPVILSSGTWGALENAPTLWTMSCVAALHCIVIMTSLSSGVAGVRVQYWIFRQPGSGPIGLWLMAGPCSPFNRTGITILSQVSAHMLHVTTLGITWSVHDDVPEMQEAGHNCDKRRALLRLVILYPSKLIGCS